MKTNLIALLASFIICGCDQYNNITKTKSAISEDWRTEQVVYQGNTAFIRYNHGLITLPKKDHPQLIRITISFKTNNPNGFPTDSESSQLWQIEDLFVDSLTQKNHAVFAGTITMQNRRHLLFYSPLSDSLKWNVTLLVQSIKNQKIEFSIYQDPEWNAYKGFYER